jgi:hypothetical protein
LENITINTSDLFSKIIQLFVDKQGIKKVDLLAAENIITNVIESVPELGDIS